MTLSKNLKYGGVIGVFVSGLFTSGLASAVGPPINYCTVSQESGTDAEFYVPSGGDGDYNILGWGHGTGGDPAGYGPLLESVAEQCILVAASTDSQAGDGTGIKKAVKEAKRRYRKIVGFHPKVCTSGHSQGGGGALNAANLLDADCVIAVQPDTVFTTRIERPLPRDTDVVCIFSTEDTLAPAEPDNANNCRNNSTRYSEEITSGSHFAPISGTGGEPGQVLRDYARRWLGD